MPYVKKLLLWIVIGAAYVVGMNVATALLRAPSDVEVAAGLIIVVAMAGGVAVIAYRCRQFFSRGTPLAVLLILVLAGCTKAPPGEVGIVVNYYGTTRGVQDVVIQTGMIWYNPMTESVLIYPTYVQTAVWTRDKNEGSPRNEEITYNSSEGLTFTADISLSYHLISDKVPAFYVKFRSDDLITFTNGYLHNVARDAFNELASQYTTSELYGDKKDEVLTKVKNAVNEKMAEIGVVIDQFGYIGAPRPPQMVVDSINRKIQAIQDAQAAENKVAQMKAQAQQDVAKAEGQAKANAILNASLTPNLIQWRTLQLTEEAIQRWNGARPMVEGAGSGLLINVTPPSVPK
jgi:regulator of protease activity HflC (stomatin/prohibitin superfamily)